MSDSLAYGRARARDLAGQMRLRSRVGVERVEDPKDLSRKIRGVVIFGRRVNRCTPGQFHTEIFELAEALRPAPDHFRASTVKQYFKEGHAMN
jgi:hypothetical protein